MKIINAILNFIGFGPKQVPELTFDQALQELTSKNKFDSVRKRAFQVIQNQDELIPDRVHPYEADLRADCIATDALITSHYTPKINDLMGNAHRFVARIEGFKNELNGASPTAVAQHLQISIGQNQDEANRVINLLREARDDLNVFRGANGITIPAVYPPSIAEAFYLIAIFGIIEAMGNWFFLHEAASGPLAIILGLAAAGINIIGNAWFGIKYREKNYLDEKRSSKGRRYFYYSVTLICILNGAIAWYRHTTHPDGSPASQFFMSGLLFAIGVILGVSAFIKGYATDDPFPGYSELDRRVKGLEKELLAIREHYGDYVAGLIRNANATIEHVASNIAMTDLKQKLIPNVSVEIEHWKNHRDQLNQAHRALLEMFRVVLTANHPNGQAYPETINPLPGNPALTGYADQLQAIRDKLGDQEAICNTLHQDTLDAQASLTAWVASDDGKALIDWPRV